MTKRMVTAADGIQFYSLDKEEEGTATIIETFLEGKEILFERKGNNIWAKNESFDSVKPTILLNSHHDTVKPNSGYIKNPFEAVIEEEKLFGLGSNDAGGCLVSLMLTFAHFYKKDLPYNLILATTAEEENSGNGISGDKKPNASTPDKGDGKWLGGIENLLGGGYGNYMNLGN